jgi:putative Holliday junction resolvase
MDGQARGTGREKRGVFRNLREKTALKSYSGDERRTTADAHRILSEAGRRGKKRKEKIDAVAATLINLNAI